MSSKKTRLLALLLSLCLLMGCSSISKLGKSDLEKAVIDVEAFFKSNEELHFSSWKNALAIISSGGEFTPEEIKHLSILGESTKVIDIAGAIFLIEAASLDSRSYNGKNYVLTLCEKQRANGEFGVFNETLFSALALENIGASYERESIIKILIDRQNPDGGFSENKGDSSSPKTTGLALSLLSCFSEDSRVKIMNERAKEFFAVFLQTPESATASELAWATMGLIDAKENVTDSKWGKLDKLLLEYESERGGFKSLKSDVGANTEASTDVLLALDAIKRGGSVWNTIVFREGAVSIEINFGDRTSLSTGRFGIYPGESVLDVTKRFCADNGVSVIFEMGNIVEISDSAKNWKFKRNSEDSLEAAARTVVKAGDTIIWE